MYGTKELFEEKHGKIKELLEKARIYIKHPSEAPRGTAVQRGPHGGYYYETGGERKVERKIPSKFQETKVPVSMNLYPELKNWVSKFNETKNPEEQVKLLTEFKEVLRSGKVSEQHKEELFRFRVYLMGRS